MRVLTRSIIAVVGVSCCLADAAEAQVKPIVTRRTAFRIPFTFDSQEVTRLGITEVQLFASRDGGRTWKHIQSTLPTGQKFRYRATEDGEYAFAVRTMDRERKLHPTGPLTPGLVVRVDTAKPAVRLEVEEGPTGGVSAMWRCSDSNLDLETLRLEYKPTNEAGQWLLLPCDKSAKGLVQLPGNIGPLAIRATVKDSAGNTGTAQQVWQSTRVVPASAEIAINPGASPPVGVDAELDESMFEPPRRASFPEATPPLVPPARPVSAGAEDVVGPFELPKAKPPITARPAVVSRSLPVQPVEQVLDANLPQVINKLKFSLDYGLEGVGSSGVSSVDVYITEDGGKKWWRYGSDRDKQSPVVLQVPRDGEYGFIISAKSGAGLGDPPPSHGDVPHATVIVDRAAPRARFDSVRLSSDGKQLNVKWTAEDQNIHDQPIRVEYSQTKTGPWQPMGDWRGNTGELAWAVSPEVPSRIFVRMVARDAAGNAGQLVYPQSILIDISKPRARINSIKVSRR